jgi:hypothetical protein
LPPWVVKRILGACQTISAQCDRSATTPSDPRGTL